MQKQNNHKPFSIDIIALLFSGKYASQREIRRLLDSKPRSLNQDFNKKVSTAVGQLKQQGWIEAKKTNDKIFYNLTKEGRVKYLTYASKTFSRVRARQSIIVIFDIPEEKRSYRNFIRRLLKQMDFTLLQRSVFVTPYILPEEFFELLRNMKLLEHFLFFEGRIIFKK